MNYIAHVRKNDREEQLVKDHLLNVQKLAEEWGAKIGVQHLTGLAGILHDLGKYSNDFQEYLRYAVTHPDDYSRRGSVDHSTAGGKLLYSKPRDTPLKEWLTMIVGNAILSHHGSLGDYLSPENLSQPYLERVSEKEIPHFDEAVALFYQEVMSKEHLQVYLDKAEQELKGLMVIAKKTNRNQDEFKRDLDLLTKFIFSCLIDADRTDTRLFEENKVRVKETHPSELFSVYLERLEKYLNGLESSEQSQTPINQLRKKMSQECADYGRQPSAIVQLSIPTGGGKTLASLRYALTHAISHHKERIIYVVPFTTIIEQNAQVIREIIADDDHLLEHHSNVLEEEISGDQFSQGQSLRNAKDNWDAPIILTTMVQYLNVFYSKGTRNSRRMHNLANSVVIFDEVQAVPLKCIALFNESLNFLKNYGKSSLVLCTATQPALDFVENKLALGEKKEIIQNLPEVTESFKRVRIVNKLQESPWQASEIVDFSRQLLCSANNVLIILNTKKAVRETFRALVTSEIDGEVFHLSTGMCAKHRSDQLEKMKESMKAGKKVVCVSSQLIEAGVDISFENVIRSLAGLDSLAQAAGRCNRNGELKIREVYVIKVSQELENTSRLDEIAIGAEITESLIKDLELNSSENGEEINLLDPAVMTRYFNNYYRKFGGQLGYYETKLDRSLYDLLGSNNKSRKDYELQSGDKHYLPLASSMKTIGKYFKVIDNETTSVLVPYDEEASRLIAQLNSDPSPDELSHILKKVQQYSINLYDQDKLSLIARNQLVPLYNSSNFSLLETAYDEVYGLNIEGDSMMGTMMY